MNVRAGTIHENLKRVGALLRELQCGRSIALEDALPTIGIPLLGAWEFGDRQDDQKERFEAMTEEEPAIKADHQLDASGKYCADLTPAIKAAMRDLARGETIEVRTDDASARVDVPAWSRLTGHQLVTMTEEDDTHTTFILKAK